MGHRRLVVYRRPDGSVGLREARDEALLRRQGLDDAGLARLRRAIWRQRRRDRARAAIAPLVLLASCVVAAALRRIRGGMR